LPAVDRLKEEFEEFNKFRQIVIQREAEKENPEVREVRSGGSKTNVGSNSHRSKENKINSHRDGKESSISPYKIKDNNKKNNSGGILSKTSQEISSILRKNSINLVNINRIKKNLKAGMKIIIQYIYNYIFFPILF